MMNKVKFTVPLRFFALLCVMFLSVSVFAQQITVNGHVKDATGEPVISAAIAVNGKNVTVTDFDGNFTVKAQKGAKLGISCIGFTKKEVTAAENLVVTMEENATSLNEAVVIGYGRAKKTDLTGSVTAIKPDDKNHGLQTNAQDMIGGKIAGVSVISDGGRPGGSAQIRIRGGSSLNASNDPLIVIDGLAMDTYGVQGLANPLSMVNPADIETFTVLKDASATAIYGSRASNGVIIITTKKGRKGQKPTVTYNGNVSIAVKKSTVDVMNGPDFMAYVKKLYGEDSEAYAALGYTNAAGEKVYADTDWQDQIYRTAVSTDHNLTVAGGAHVEGVMDMPYRVSVGFTDNNGILKTSYMKRYTASFNLSPSFLDDHLTFNINGKGMIAKNRYADEGAIGAALFMDPTKPVYSDNAISQTYFGGYGGWYQTNEIGDDAWPYGSNRNATSNPLMLLELNRDRATSKSLIGNIEADYKVHGLEDLHFHINGGMDVSTGEQTRTISPYSTAYVNSIYANYFGYNGWNKKDTYNLQLSMYAQYMKNFGDDHHFDIMAGYEWQHYHQKSDYTYYGTYRDTHPWGAGLKYGEPTTTTQYKSENYLVSFFGRANYSLMNKYMLTFTLRDDGSSRFSKGNKWGLFPSLALAWRMKEETFLKNIEAINDAKLRLGWGITGQQEGIGDYTYIATYTASQDGAYYFLDEKGIPETNYRPDAYNKDLTWEKTTTWNAGVDFNFFNDRLTFSADYYYRKTKDLINTVYVPTGVNFANKVTSNIGSLHNTGVEFTITGRPIQTSDMSLELSYNFTYNHNEIDELIGGSDDSYFVETGGINGVGHNIQAHAVGHAASSFYVYQQAYDENGKIIPNTFVDRNGDGIINTSDKYFYYKPAADVLMGFSAKFTYKNWDLSTTLRASLGNYVYNDVLSSMREVGSGSIYSNSYLGNRSYDAIELGITNPLTEQIYSDYFVQNASFLKCDNITLGYSFENLFGSKIGGRVYATAQNVFTITKYDGLDPEVSGGIDNNIYPRPFTTVVGVTLKF